MAGNRYEQLDSLRGIASSQVFLMHLLSISSVFFAATYWGVPDAGTMYSTSKWAYILTYTPLAFFKAGNEAVVFFFILSGFVLSGTLFNRVNYLLFKQYLVKRFFRLWVPFIIVIVLSIILRKLFYTPGINSHPEISFWFKKMWEHPVSVINFIKFLFLQGGTHNVDTTLWSLIIEIKISILLPLFILLMDRLNNGYKNAVFLIVVILVSHFSFSLLSDNPKIIYDAKVLHYVSPFILGAYLNKYLKFWVNKINNYSNLSACVLFFIMVILYCIDGLKHFIEPVPALYYIVDSISYEVQMFASLAFIILSFHSVFQRRLLHSIWLRLGQISYSLYLIHPLLLLSVTYLLLQKWQLFEIWVLLIPLTLGLSYVFYRYVETPINDYGRELAKKLKGKKAEVDNKKKTEEQVKIKAI
ncbi:peptidoglycan/LPS O-acetylase OafA/YrhL [Mucilaginibacter sp. OAE612]|uniref:acyltransferase family protein n=1 Tax=Mucilaginibacter sp. OAE612 TaxID=3156444 RepID=UPI00359D32B4